MNANSGGIHIGNDITTVISRVAISDNRVSAVAPFAEPCTFDSALLVNDSPARVSDVLVSGNSVSGFIQKSADLGPCGSAVDFDGGSATTRPTWTSGSAGSASIITPRPRCGAAAPL